MGDGTRNQQRAPTVIDEISHLPMRSIAAGSSSGAISDDASSSLFLWGTGAFGEFLTPHRVKRI